MSNGIPLINPTHIKNQKIEPNYNLTVNFEKIKELQEFVMNIGDIVIGRRGEMGRCAVVTETENGWLCGTGSLYIRLIDGMNSYFYSWILGSERVKSFLSEFSVGTTMQNLNQKILHSVPVPLCINEEQIEVFSRFSYQYEQVEKKIFDMAASIRSADAQRKNILKDAFSGKLVPQDPNDEPASVLLERIKLQKKINVDRLAKEKQSKPKQPKKKANSKASIMNTLSEVLKTNGDWMNAQDAFRACGVSDNTETDRIEELYAELRKLDKAGKLLCERNGDYDMIKLKDE